MEPSDAQAPDEMARAIAQRARTLRLDRGWTQRDLAERAGTTRGAVQHFERTGRIALDRLVAIAAALEAAEGFAGLFARPAPQSLPELAERTRQPPRQRGRSRRSPS
jgi:transcriptional regulator with XRE-family HTH domain